MKNSCILVSNCNFELAYNIKKHCQKFGIELYLSTNIVEMFGQVSQNTKTVIVDCKKADREHFSKQLGESIKYKVLFIENNKLYNNQDRLIYKNIEELFLSELFLQKPKGYQNKQYITAVERCFEDLKMVVTTKFGQLIKQTLYFMLSMGENKITKQQLELIAGKLGIGKSHIYEKAAMFLKPHWQTVNQKSQGTLVRYNTKKILEYLYNLTVKYIEPKV